MPSDSPPASLFEKNGMGALVGGAAAERRERLLRLARLSDEKNADHTSLAVWWLVASPAAAVAVRSLLLSAGVPGRLHPGVMTLRQAAERLNRHARPALLPLGPAARRALIGEIASNAEHRSSLGPLEELKESPGLVDFLASRFRQLRRDGIAAEQAGETLRRLDGGRAGNVLANLYRDYLQALGRGSLIDDEGQIAAATDQAASADLKLQRLLIDLPLGVCPIEERLVQAIADHAEECFVACTGPIEEASASHPDRGTRLPASLKQRSGWCGLLDFRNPEVFTEPRSNRRPAALCLIRDHLFDDHADADQSADGVRVIAGGGLHDTARRVARRVKLMLTEGAVPSDLVLAAPDLERSAPRYVEALAEYGVPVAVDAAPHLASAPVMQIVLDLLTLVETDWSFEALTTLIRRSDLPLLGNREEAAGFSSARIATEWFVRELQVPSGQKYLHRQAEQIASRPDAGDHLDRLRDAGRAAVGVFETLAHALEALPEEATALGWFDAIDTVLRRLGHTGLTTAADPADRGAGDVIEEACASLENLARWRDRKPRLLRWRGMLELLRSWSQRLRLPNRDSSEGRVRLVGTTTAVGLSVRHLIVVDADETAFTSTTGDAEDAMLGFYELATTPTESLTFAYAALDASAQPMLPSPYVTEIERLFAPQATRRDNEPLLATVSTDLAPASNREWRQRAVLQAMAGEAKELTACDPSGALTTSLASISARARGETFGSWEGILDGAASHAILAERFGSQHLWSASQLELMATCPFKFFSRQVLRLDEAGELTLGIDHRRRGSLMHDALAECLTKLIETLPPGQTLRDVPPDELSLRLSNQIDELCDTGKLPLHEAALAAIEARQTSDWAERYADQQRRFHNDKRWNDLDRPLTPTLLEARFGPAKGEPDAAEDSRSTDRTFELTLPNGEVLQLTGRIDRIDTARHGDQLLFSVVDYKTSKELRSTRAQMESGKQLQPVLYAMAARELFLEDEAIPVAAGYWAVRQKGFVGPSDKELPLMTYDTEGRVLPSDAWQEVVDAVRQRCETLVADIRGGRFPMFNDDEHCGQRCEFRTVCRVGQARSLNKLPAGVDGQEKENPSPPRQQGN